MAIANLGHEERCCTVLIQALGFEQVVRAPAHSAQQGIHLARIAVAVREADATPGMAGEGGGQREPELHVIARIVVPPTEIQAQIGLQVLCRRGTEVNALTAIGQAGISAPGNPVVGLIEIPRSVRFVKEERQPQGSAVADWFRAVGSWLWAGSGAGWSRIRDWRWLWRWCRSR